MTNSLAHLSRRILPAVLGVTAIAGCSSSGGHPAATRTATPSVVASAAATGSAAASSPPAAPSAGPSSAAPSGQADPALEPFYGQQIAWGRCAPDPEDSGVDMSVFQCGTAHVPLDYGNPGLGTVDLALIRKSATQPGHKLGSLFFDPGGPGGSGVNYLAETAVRQFGALNADYDLIGFDPRGVGASTPVHCLDDATRDRFVAQPHATDTTGKEFESACAARSGKLLAYVGTVNAARDLDVLRAAVGEQKLDYLGFSYGTYLGADYADQFPDRTGRLVLDGAMDPSVGPLQGDVQQQIGFEGVYERFAKDCVSQSDCPLGSDPDTAAKKAADFLDGLDAQPLTSATSGRVLNSSLAWTGTLGLLYGSAKDWQYLRLGLSQAMRQHRPDLMLAFADNYNGRDQQGHYSNEADANAAINCADEGGPAPTADQLQQALQQLHQQAPYLTHRMTVDDLALGIDCSAWPHQQPTPPQQIKAAGSAPILVVGSTGDDATPYQWAQHLSTMLADATLLTRDGDGHTAYDKSSCVQRAVNAFLLGGTMPAAGTHCATDNQDGNG
ncbi:alpha/beta hydrolase [Kitasatospora sp. LaBMicrA B282]|uniref:alpha/beta hydrolase n=1 Tax=Kitasatospora sp. LaBMicrA B282 TaxID=3420949 RepID=UPI003D1435B2